MVNETKKIQSVERAMYLLELIAASGGRARLSHLVAQTHLNKSTIHGLLNTLTALGYIQREGTAYALGLRLREISLPLTDKDEKLRQHFRSLLETLHQQTQENIYLATPCGTREYLYIDTIGTSNHYQGISPRGKREGLTTSAMGKIFLAFIPEMQRSLRRANKLPEQLNNELKTIAQQGYALDLGEAEAGLFAFAIPLYLNGHIVAGLSLAGHETQWPSEQLIHTAKKAILTATAWHRTPSSPPTST